MQNNPKEEQERKRLLQSGLRGTYQEAKKLENYIVSNMPFGTSRSNVRNALYEFRKALHTEYGRLTIDEPEAMQQDEVRTDRAKIPEDFTVFDQFGMIVPTPPNGLPIIAMKEDGSFCDAYLHREGEGYSITDHANYFYLQDVIAWKYR
jgi:hypothetical protein